MSIVEQDVPYVEGVLEPPENPEFLQWFRPLYLSAVNDHPWDNTIQHLSDGTFYVRWSESETIGVSDRLSEQTVSVSTLLRRAVHAPHAPHTPSSTLAAREPDHRREAGIRLHRWIECVLNGFPMDMEPFSVVHQQVQAYYRDCLHPRLRPWRTEMIIRSTPDYLVVGVVDALFVGMCPDAGETLFVHLKDWKYSPDISTRYEEYVLQLNCYQFILESAYTGIPFQFSGRTYRHLRVVSRELVLFHETLPSYSIQVVREIQTEIRTQMCLRKKSLN